MRNAVPWIQSTLSNWLSPDRGKVLAIDRRE
jgi:hypothetical protein